MTFVARPTYRATFASAAKSLTSYPALPRDALEAKRCKLVVARGRDGPMIVNKNLADLFHLNRSTGFHRLELFHVSSRLGPDVGFGGEADFIALRDRRAAEADGDGVAFDPEGELAGLDHVAGVGFAFHMHRRREINLLAPGICLGGERQRVPDRLRRGRVQQL